MNEMPSETLMMWAVHATWEANRKRIEELERALRAARPYVAIYTGDPSLSNTANETWLLIGQALRGEEQ